jgi:hypothetical protein
MQATNALQLRRKGRWCGWAASAARFPCSGFTDNRRLRGIGRCAPFADPMVAANATCIFWSPDRLLSSLPVLARRAPVDLEGRPDVYLGQLGTVRGVLIDASGTEHIMLQAGWHTITLRSQGASIIDTPVNLTFLFQGLRGLANARRLLPLARSLLDPVLHAKLAPKGPAPWHRKLREALVALDGYQAGASQRDIAAALFGRDSAEEAWHKADLSLKQRVHRAVAKGRALSAGGYLALLRSLGPW